MGSLSLRLGIAFFPYPGEKRKPEYLEGLPEKTKLYSEVLGKQPWFAGNKVKGGGGKEEPPIFPGVKFQRAHPGPPAGHLRGFPGL